MLPGRVETTRKHWAASSSIATDDALLREIFDHARFGLPGMVADNGVMDAGMFEYGGQWVRDTSNTLLGLVHAGQFELARSGFEHVLKDMIRDDGGGHGLTATTTTPTARNSTRWASWCTP